MFDSKSSRSEDFINHDEIIKVLEYGRDHKNDSEMVDNILKKAETSMDNVVKTTCFLTDMKDFAAFNEVYAKHFPGKPARSCFAVKDLPAGALCEIEVIAVK